MVAGGIIPWMADTVTGAFVSLSTVSGTNYLGAYATAIGGGSTAAYQTSTSDGTWATGDNVSATTTYNLTGARTVNSLSLRPSSAITLGLGGNTLTLASGGLLSKSQNNIIQSGTITAGSNELFVHALGSILTINASIADNGSAVALTKGGAGELDLGGVNAYTGPTTIGGGILKVLSGGSLNAASTVTVAQGATLTVNAGGTVSGNVNASISTGAGVANFTNNGTVSGTVTTAAPPVGPVYVYGGNALAGYASLGAGSVTGPIVNNGRLDVSGSLTSVGAISGSGSTGYIYNNNTTYVNGGAGSTLTFQGGSSFSMATMAANTFGTMAYTGTGAVYIG